MVYGIIGILTIIIIILGVKLGQKISIDNKQLEIYKKEISETERRVEKLHFQKDELTKDIKTQTNLISEYNDKLIEIQNKYKQELNKKTTDLDLYFENQKLTRQSEMDTNFERLWREKEENLKSKYDKFAREELEKEEKFKQQTQEIIQLARESQKNILAETRAQQERFEGLLLPLKQYEMEQQERLFYTIQVPDEYKDDISFLLTSVAAKVQHPDIINKLVWAEYVKPYIDDTFKRVGVKDECGIYKLTSLINGKCYIGKSTNIKKRIADHMKSVVGISTIADQAVHHVIAREGYWNWTIEPIIYCEKDKLNDLEKYYIDFFKSNSFGYNKTKGGEG